MRITFKLYASLTEYMPVDQRRGNTMSLDVEPGTAIDALVARFRLPPKLVHLVLVNGVFVAPEARAAHVLSDGDVLAIWPPIAGG